MDNNSVTYWQVHQKLKSLGYHRHAIEINGKPGEMFEHDQVPEARILLPERPQQEPVEATYVNYVLMVLKSNGIIEEENPLLK